MIKILFLINTLGGGGAEKVLVNLVNNMDRSQFDITVETMFSGGVNQTILKPDIKYICKNAFTMKGISHIYKFLPSKYLYKKFINQEKYDIIVAYMHNLPVKVITGCQYPATKLIGWLHCGTVEEKTYCTCWHTKNSANKSYNRCDVLVGVSKLVVKEFERFFNVTTDCCSIFNTNDTKLIKTLSQEKPTVAINQETISISTVGRLSFEKGNDRLVNAANELLNQGYDFHVFIIGEGAEKQNLIEQIQKYGIENNVHLLGFHKNPYAIVRNTDIFVCPSRIEGFSTAVTEAVILNKPVVSTEVSGAKEILGENNEFGLVVENSTDGVYEGIKRLLDDNSLLSHYRAQAEKRAVDFETEKTVQQAEDLFKSLLINK